ncbi:mycofactocin biosynthesis peptidyl-dipeptidase MftE [Streptomyces tendae]|uniref:mycofactocin biosynthesis peptidyl-dipeptidase MftE n=1 Tax=Streptomyces tendae TaxID=1932 RepID=UPI0033F71964
MPLPSTDRSAPQELARTPWPDISHDAWVLVPVGSTEQHGPHLPLDTDSVIARAVALRAARALASRPGGPPLVAPTLAYGSSGEHAGFPGTVSIGHDALGVVLVEMVRSLSLWARRVVFVNGHGGNTRTFDDAVGRMRAEGHDVAWTCCEAPGGDAHAGRTETSVMLHLAPADVRTHRAAPGDTRPLSAVLPELVARGVRAVSPSGVLGDPTGARAEEGRGVLEEMVRATVRRIEAGTVDHRGRLVDTAPHAPRSPRATGPDQTRTEH